MTRRFKLDVLMSTLAARRTVEGISWREIGRQAGVSASTLSRMLQGGQPDINTVVALLTWLGLPTEDFLTDGEFTDPKSLPPIPPALHTALAPLLQEGEVSLETGEALAQLISGAYRLFKSVEAAAVAKVKGRVRRS